MNDQSRKIAEATEGKLDFKRVLPVIFIVFVDLMGLTIIIPILPFYAAAFGASAFVIGLLGASYPFMQLIGGPLLGGLSDRYGRKPVLACAQVGTFISLLVLAFSGNIYMLFFARIIDGITGANLPTVQAAITDVTTSKTRSQGLGLIGAAFGMGFILGPVIAGIALRLTDNNYSAPALVASGFALASVLLTTFVFEETLPPEKRGTQTSARSANPFARMWSGLQMPAIRILFLLIFMQQVVFGAFQNMFAPFTLSQLGLNSLGNTVFFTYIGVLIVLFQGGLIRPLTNRFGEHTLIYAGLGIVSAGLILMSLTPQQPVPWYSQEALIAELGQSGAVSSADQLSLLPPEENQGVFGLILLLIAMTPIAIGNSILAPSINSLITQRVSPREVGAILGIGAAFLSLANVLGPLVGGVLFDFVSHGAPFWMGGLVSAGLMLVAFNRVKGTNPSAVEPEPA